MVSTAVTVRNITATIPGPCFRDAQFLTSFIAKQHGHGVAEEGGKQQRRQKAWHTSVGTANPKPKTPVVKTPGNPKP